MLLTNTLYSSMMNLRTIINHFHTSETRCKGNSHCGQFVGQSVLWRALGQGREADGVFGTKGGV